MTFLGGRATLWGPVIGAFLLETAQQYLAYSLGGSQFYLIAYALVFLVVMLVMPRGIVPSVQERARQRRLRRARDSSGGSSSRGRQRRTRSHRPGCVEFAVRRTRCERGSVMAPA